MGWSDLIGRQLGQYAIVGELGRGGSSRVYRAQDLESMREVAIKVIFNDAEDRVGFVRRFEREVQAIAQLDHPNIVAVYDRGETADLVYLVMQCVTGGTLRQRCGRPIPVAEACGAMVQMCHALHHAHQHGIIHRDVKPSNMLIDSTDPRYLLLTDFGIAKLQGMLGLTKSGTTIGTPEYMSPEQSEGKDIDQRTDVYALGCVLFELLAGRPPFVGSTAVSVLYQQVHLRPPHLRAFNSEVPRELGRIIEQALAKHPEERFGTAAMMAEALLSYAEGSLPQLPNELARVPTGQGRSSRLSGPLSGPLRTDSAIVAAGSGAVLGSSSLEAPPIAPPISAPSPIAPISDDARVVLPPVDTYWPPAGGSGELATPTDDSWQGLGSDGLDALFPGDVESESANEARIDAIVNTPTLDEMPRVSPQVAPPRPAVARESSRSIPLPAFRLPSKPTRPLSTPLTASGRLDIEALMAQIEAQGQRSPVPEDTSSAEAPSPEDGHTPSYGSRLGVSDPAIADHDTDEMPVLPAEPRHRVGSGIAPSRLDKGRRRSLPLGSVVAATICLLLLAGVLISVFVLNSHLNAHRVTTVPATATPTLTPQPSPTATSTTAATATVNPQIALDKQAAAAFSSVILSAFADDSCSSGNQSRRFSPGQNIYIDLCTRGGPFPGPVTVTIRQGGVGLYVVVSNVYLSPNSGYFFFRYGLGSGGYDMVVTMPVNGTIAVARDLPFTVG